MRFRLWWRRRIFYLRQRSPLWIVVLLMCLLLVCLLVPNPFSARYKPRALNQDVQWQNIHELLQVKEQVGVAVLVKNVFWRTRGGFFSCSRFLTISYYRRTSKWSNQVPKSYRHHPLSSLFSILLFSTRRNFAPCQPIVFSVHRVQWKIAVNGRVMNSAFTKRMRSSFMLSILSIIDSLFPSVLRRSRVQCGFSGRMNHLRWSIMLFWTPISSTGRSATNSTARSPSERMVYSVNVRTPCPMQSTTSGSPVSFRIERTARFGSSRTVERRHDWNCTPIWNSCRKFHWRLRTLCRSLSFTLVCCVQSMWSWLHVHV